MKNFLLYLRYSSIEMAIAGLACGIFANKIAHFQPPKIWYVLLPLAVWVIYLADHYLDGQKVKEKASHLRHSIHYRYRNITIALIVICSFLGITLAFLFYNSSLLIFGGIGIILIILYFIAIKLHQLKWFYIPKELIIATIFCFGIWAFPLFQVELNIRYLVFMLIFWGLILINLMIYSLFDEQSDEQDGFRSLVVYFGRVRVKQMLNISFWTLLFLLAIGFTTYFIEPSSLALRGLSIYAIILISHLIILLMHKSLVKNQLYRILGDLIFISPLLILI